MTDRQASRRRETGGLAPDQAVEPAASGTATEATYDILGVRVRVRSDLRAAIDLIDESYGVLQASIPAASASTITLTHHPDRSPSFVVSDDRGSKRGWATSEAATLDLMDQLVLAVTSGLHARDLFAVHAAAVAQDGRALALAGPSGAGKTTLALALAARGFELLSDELAVLEPATGLVHPYRRRLHVRPGTPELVRGVEHIAEREQQELGGGIAWAVDQDEIGLIADGPRRLAGVVILEPRDAGLVQPTLRPTGSGRATLELLRGTWAATVDFEGALRAVGSCVADVPCATLAAANPMVTADALIAWLDGHHG